MPLRRLLLLPIISVSALTGGSGPANGCDSCSCTTSHAHPPTPAAVTGRSQLSIRPLDAPTSMPGAPGRGAPLTFAVVGDTQGGEFGSGILEELTRDIAARQPDFVLFPGDLIADTGQAGWEAWKQSTAALGNRRLMTPGNHDRGNNATFSQWQSTFDWLPESQPINGVRGIDGVDYFVDAGGIRFISIGSDLPGQSFGSGTPTSFDWLQQVLADVDRRNSDGDPGNDIDHVFPFSHRPITTQNESRTGGTNGTWWQTMTGQAASSHTEATAFLAGHWHMYQPSRPDPHVETVELIAGTGGGGLEGAPFRNRHGFTLVTVDGENVSASFYSDANGGNDGWSFTDKLDTFILKQEGGLGGGELARYPFELRGIDQDTSTSPLSKNHRLRFHGGASVVQDPLQGSVLRLENSQYVDARAIGDNNLAVLRDLTVSLAAKMESLGTRQTLLSFGGAFGALNGSLANQESANVAYELSLTAAGYLEFSWQHDDGEFVSVTSSAIVDDPLQWRTYEFRRDADQQGVAFFVDGKLLGQTFAFDQLPTGAGSGSLTIGAGAGGRDAFSGWIDNVVLDSGPVEVIAYRVGDFNTDGSIDHLDWLFFADNLGTQQPSITDLNGDGATNYPDFLLFKDLFDQTHGPGAFQTMLSNLPEPAGIWGLAVGAWALASARKGVRNLL